MIYKNLLVFNRKGGENVKDIVNKNSIANNVNKKAKFKIGKKNLEDYAWGYIMIAPTIIGLIILNMWPIVQTLYLSFTKSEGLNSFSWVGISNYKQMLSDSAVFHATINTLKYTIITVPVGVILSLIIAVLLNSKIKGKTIYRTIYFLPMVSAPAAIAMVWKWLYNSDYGLFNYLLSLIGIKGPNWLTNPHTAISAIIVVVIWSSLGYNMIILLAGLQEIPQTLYEAADIDGAGPIRKFFNITLPLVSPTMFFVVITTLMGALQIFDLIFMMIGNSSALADSTQSLVSLFYKYSFVMNDKGYGSAIIMYLLVIIMIITFIQLKLQKKWVHYD
ncbi:MAG: sugar transporter permease [Clostridium sp.]|jgi:multiple sugar transport system permease protein|nr:sugar transporter permease [Clostridium sp.]